MANMTRQEQLMLKLINGIGFEGASGQDDGKINGCPPPFGGFQTEPTGSR